MAAELEQHFPDATVELIPSKGGRFEVTCDATPVFQKSRVGRHAARGEVVRLIEALQSTR